MSEDRDIRIPSVSSFDHWPQSYQFMYDDLTKSISLAKANYLVALGLFCYSEIVGRDILRFRENNIQAPYRNNKRCFEVFARDYLMYGDILDAHPNLYDIYRNGLGHEYYIKREYPGGGSEVYLYYSDDEQVRQAIAASGVDLTKGIAISTDGKKRAFVIEPYLKDFVVGVDRLTEEMWGIQWNPDLR